MNRLNLVNKEGFELERIYLDILQLPINIDSIEFINRLNISNVLNNLFSNITKTSKSFKIFQKEISNIRINKNSKAYIRCIKNLSIGLLNYNNPKIYHIPSNKKEQRLLRIKNRDLIYSLDLDISFSSDLSLFLEMQLDNEFIFSKKSLYSWRLGILDINLGTCKKEKDNYSIFQLLKKKKCTQCQKLLSIEKFIPFKWNFEFGQGDILANNICSCCQKSNLENENRNFIPHNKHLNKRRILVKKIHNMLYLQSY